MFKLDSLKSNKITAVRFRILLTLALLMMIIGDTCPWEAPIRRVVYSVYDPLLFFVFGAKYIIARKREEAATARAVDSSEGPLKAFISGMLSDLKEIGIPLFIMSLFPYLIEIGSYDPVPGMRTSKLKAFLKALFYCSGAAGDRYRSVGCLWFLAALLIIRVLCRFLSLITRSLSKVIVGSIFAGIGIISVVMALILTNVGIVLPFSVNNAMAGMLFFMAGVLYIEFYNKLRHIELLIVGVSLPIWIAGLIFDRVGVFGAGSFPDPFAFIISLCGIMVFLFITALVERYFPKGASYIGVPGKFPLVFICMHSIDESLSMWFGWGGRYLNMALKFTMLTILSLTVGHIIRSFKDTDRYSGEISDKRRKAENIAFYVCFAICYARVFANGTMYYLLISDMTLIDRIYSIAILGLVVLAGFSIQRNSDIRIKAFYILLIITGYMQWRCGMGREFFALPFLIIAIAGRRLEPALIISLIISAIEMTGAYIGSVTGYLPYFVYNTGGVYGSHAFGMVYRTDIAAHILYMIMSYAVLRREKLRSAGYVLMVFACWFCWRYAQARANLFAMLAFLSVLIIWLLIHGATGKKFTLPRISAAVHTLCCVGILGMVFLYKGKTFNVADLDLDTFWARLYLSVEGFREYPLRLIGKGVFERGAGGLYDSSEAYFFLDITYVRNIISYGILFALIYLAVMTIASWRAAKEKNTVLGLALIIVALVSIIEHHATDFSYNVLILAAFADVSVGSKGERDKEAELKVGK